MLRLFHGLLLSFLIAGAALAATLYDEAVSGDLVDAIRGDVTLALVRGDNVIRGSLSARCPSFNGEFVDCVAGDLGDAFALTAAPGDRLVSLTTTFSFAGAPRDVYMPYGLYVGDIDAPGGLRYLARAFGLPGTFDLGGASDVGLMQFIFILNGIAEDSSGPPFDPNLAFDWTVAITVAGPAAVVPLPAAALTLPAGLLALGLLARRRRAA